MATPENLAKKVAALRFKVGDRVECNMGEGKRLAGTVADVMYRDSEMEQGQVCPYYVKLDAGYHTWAPMDEDDVIRAEGDKGKKKQRTE